MPCLRCQSTVVRRRTQRTALGYRRFSCGICHRRFNERTGSPFNELWFPTDIVLLAVLWRLRYKLGLRDVTFWEVGAAVRHNGFESVWVVVGSLV